MQSFWRLNYTDPNYNFLGNSLNYFVSSTENDKPDQGYENTLMAAGVNTSFEQFKNIYTNLGVSISHDDLQTLDSASANLKKQAGSFSELLANYGLVKDTRNRAFMPQVVQLFLSTNRFQYSQINKLLLILLKLPNTNQFQVI